MAETVVASISKRLAPAFNLCWPMMVGRYNATLTDRPDLRLPFPDTALALLIGNTREAWEPVKGFCQQRVQTTGSLPANPFEELLGELLDAALSSPHVRQQQHRVYWSQNVEDGELVAMNRAAEASGHVTTESISHLSCHPVYGPWISFRALVVFPELTAECIKKPSTPVAPVVVDHETSAAIKEAMDYALAAPGEWRRWVAVRDTVAQLAGGEHRYPDDQIAYHYAHDRTVLPHPATRTGG